VVTDSDRQHGRGKKATWEAHDLKLRRVKGLGHLRPVERGEGDVETFARRLGLPVKAGLDLRILNRRRQSPVDKDKKKNCGVFQSCKESSGGGSRGVS